MSNKELTRAKVIQRVLDKAISQKEASGQLGLTSRQVRRLQVKYQRDGAKGLLSKHRGRAANNKLSAELKKTALTLISAHYQDFKPTFACEKLVEDHGIKISKESVRKLMIEHGLWKGRRRRSLSTHPLRARRSSFGELVQIDGSPHDWFEGRRDKCCLLVFIDDATSRLLALHFEENESTQGYFETCKKHFDKHGKPAAYYSDKHSIFRVNQEELKKDSEGETQFARAMRELGIELIYANSPQAKGRVEKANGTLQDRLVKELRLRGISDIKTANEYLSTFIDDYNKRFAVDPASEFNAHKALGLNKNQLNQILSKRTIRTISKDLQVHYNNKIYQIQSDKPAYTMKNSKLEVIDNQGFVTLRYKGKSLPFKIFEKARKQNPIAGAKDLNQVVDQRLYPTHINKPKPNHPWRKTRPTKANGLLQH